MEIKNWYEEWFDSPYYHLLYANRNAEEAKNFVCKITDELKVPKRAKVIDVGCGKGRHSRMLASLGFDVTGIDLSKNNIAFAKQFENEHLKFDVWDMRGAYRKGEFDYVFNLFSTFGYFDDDKDDFATIKAFADNLNPGGTLVFDYFNSEAVVKLMKPKQIIPSGDVHFHIQKKLEGGFIKKKIDFLAEGTNYTFEEKLKIITLSKFEKMFSEAGFELKNIYGDYELNEFNSSKSLRLILIARKND